MAKEKTQGGFWSKSFLDSRIKSANTEGKEKVWGYFVGPMFMMMAYYGIAGTYITQFYTDVLGISGALLTLMPFFSKIIDAITNVIMGRIIDRTRTKQGKARPWMLGQDFSSRLPEFCYTMCPEPAIRCRLYGLL